MPDLNGVQLNVIARNTPADNRSVLDAQLFENVLFGRGGCSCSEGTDDRRIRKALHELSDPQVVLAKSGALLADAVRLINHDTREISLAERHLYLAIL